MPKGTPKTPLEREVDELTARIGKDLARLQVLAHEAARDQQVLNRARAALNGETRRLKDARRAERPTAAVTLE